MSEGWVFFVPTSQREARVLRQAISFGRRRSCVFGLGFDDANRKGREASKVFRAASENVGVEAGGGAVARPFVNRRTNDSEKYRDDRLPFAGAPPREKTTLRRVLFEAGIKFTFGREERQEIYATHFF